MRGDRAEAGADRVDLPAYDLWRFATGADGDFETLAERLLPVAPAPGVGRRRVDTSRPGMGIAPVDAAEVREVYGPLVRVGDPDHRRPELARGDHRGAPAAGRRARRGRVRAGEAPDPTLGPPLYAGAHLARRTVPAEGTEPAWARTLNLDPADRIVAGLGTRVVRMDQEAAHDLRLAAGRGGRRRQRGPVRGGPRALRRRVAAPAAARPDGNLGPRGGHRPRALAPARRPGADDRRTHRGERPRPGGRRPPAAPGRPPRPARSPVSPARLAERVGATRSLRRLGARAGPVVGPPYTEPDGVRGVQDSTLRTLLELLADQADLLAAAQDAIAASAFIATAGDPRVDVMDLVTASRATPPPRSCAARSRRCSPAADARGDRGRPRTGAADRASTSSPGAGRHRARLRDEPRQLVARGGPRRRLELDGEPGRRRIPSASSSSPSRSGTGPSICGLRRRVRRHRRADPQPGRHPRRFESLLRAEDGLLARDLELLRDGLVVDTRRFGDIQRDAFPVADLRLLDRLDPRLTSVRRIRDRLTRWPAWLPGDWFDDTRLERVMVAPRFRHPMYEALDRYDREWLLPGVGAIKPQEMVTLLSTNERFVESFLIGLNTEMARELLWREYPTDGRATSFRSFWTTGDELLAEVHALGAGPLGTHIDPIRGGDRAPRTRRTRPALSRPARPCRHPDRRRPPADVRGGPGNDALPSAPRSGPAPGRVRAEVRRRARQRHRSRHRAARRRLVVRPVRARRATAVRARRRRPASRCLPQARRPGVVRLDPAPPGSYLPGRAERAGDRPAGNDAAALAWLLFQQPSRAAFRGARMIAKMS